MHPAPYPTISLDSIANNVFYHVGKHTPKLLRNRAPFLLRTLVSMLYGASKGFLFHASIRASHKKLAAKLGISREWTCKLLKRLVAAGWIKTYAPRLANGKQEITTYKAGGKLQQLLVAMLKSPQRDKNRVNSASQVFPHLNKEEVKETDRQTNSPIPKGFVEGFVGGLGEKMSLLKQIRW